MIKVSLSVTGRCDISGEDIHTGEPAVNLTGDRSIKLENIQDFIEGLEEVQKTPFYSDVHVGFNIIMSQSSWETDCMRCDESKKNGVKVKLMDGEIEKCVYNVCNDCMDEYIEDIRKFKDYVDNQFYYWSEKGFQILNTRYNEKELENFIDGGTVDEKYALSIGCSEIIVTKLSNILKTVRLFNNHEDFDYISQKDDDSLIYKEECSICQETKKKCLKVENFDFRMCTMCRDIITTELEEYYEENKEFISSIGL
jgi:hypothetical protein